MQTGGMQQPVEGHHHKDHHKRHEAEAAGMPPTNDSSAYCATE